MRTSSPMKARNAGQTSGKGGASCTAASEYPWTLVAPAVIGRYGFTSVWNRSTISPPTTRTAPTSTTSQTSTSLSVVSRSEEHTSELQSLAYLVCRLLLEKKKNVNTSTISV